MAPTVYTVATESGKALVSILVAAFTRRANHILVVVFTVQNIKKGVEPVAPTV
jgi:hypothetical protein